MIRHWCWILVLLAVLSGCAGEGGGSSDSAKAFLDLAVVWPARGRVVPAASDRITTVVRPTLEGAPIGQLTLTRPTASGRIPNIPVGRHYVISEALDAAGKVLATRTIQTDFASGATVEMTLDLDSVITSLEIAPTAPTVMAGETLALAAGAKNSAGDAVLLTPSKLEWTIVSGGSSASVGLKTGILSGTIPGAARVRVLDTESGVAAEAPVTVSDPPTMVDLTPGSVTQMLATKLSGDGSKVVGMTNVNSQAFLWTSGVGMAFIGTLGGPSSFANDISTDGTTVIGWSFTSANAHRAFRWTQLGGMVNLQTLGGDSSYAYGVNGDGSVVVGVTKDADGNDRPFIWKSSTGLQLLDPSLKGGPAIAVSHDGTVVVGHALKDGVSSAFRWTQAGGVQYLGTLGGWSQAADVSDDGSVIVGTSQTTGTERRAFVWTQAGGMQALGTLGGALSGASGVSGDGLIVTGTASDPSENQRAFSWTQAGGMAPLGTLGGQNSSAGGISRDGRFIAGSALTSASLSKAFRMKTPQRP